MKEHSGKILGVLGGMGPAATQLFYRMILEKTDASCDQEHLDMIILNHATMIDRTKAILEGREEELLSLLLKDARLLEREGAVSIAIPCNTSHVVIDRLQAQLQIPVIHMIKETAIRLKEQVTVYGAKVGILATDGTIHMGLYQRELEKLGMAPVIPSPPMQKLVMKIIYDGVKNGGKIEQEDFVRIEEELLFHQCEKAILACTELSCFKEMVGLPAYYVDAMAVLAEKSILSCGKTCKVV